MKNRTLLLVVLLASVAYWALLCFHIPVLQSLPWWFWDLRDTRLESPLYLLLGITFAGASVAVVLFTHQRPALKLLLLVAAVYALQMAFGLAEGRGMELFRDRLIKGGQRECINVAVGRYSIIDMARHYEDLLDSELWQHDYMRTKPPGSTLFFMFVERTTHWFTGEATSEKRVQNLSTVAAFLFPFLAALTVIPLFFFSRLFLPEHQAIIPPVLFALSPNVVLLTMSIDQFLFPLMAMVVLWLSAFSAAKANPTLAFSAGIALYLSIYASFTLIPLLLLTPLVAATIWATREKSQRSLQGLAILNSAGAAGFLIMLLLFQVLFHYDILTRFSAALSAHQDIKSWMPGIDYTIAFAFINNVEFACGIGIAIAIVFVDQLAATIIGATQKRIDSAGYLVATVVMALVGLAIFGKVKAESARLWLFLVPLVCVVATNRIVRRFGTNPRHVVLFLLALQLVTTLVLKRYEDFWRPPA